MREGIELMLGLKGVADCRRGGRGVGFCGFFSEMYPLPSLCNEARHHP